MTAEVSKALSGCLALEKKALEAGLTRACLIWTEDIIYDPRSRIKCRLNTCGNYGTNFQCPPSLPDIETYIDMNSRYKLALLAQSEEKCASEVYDEAMEKQAKAQGLNLLKALVGLERSCFGLGFPYALASAGGSCKICNPCKARLGEKACAHPELARPSMEAMGIDIAATCRRAGYSADFLPGRLLLTGLLYIC